MTTQTQVRSTEEALKLALEALEDENSLSKMKTARDILRKALAQPEQEPVAWQQVMERAFWRMYDHGKDNNPVSAQCEIQALRLLCDGTFDDVTAWHPSQWKLPQRKPLKDEQIDEAIQQYVDPVATYQKLHDFARAIEAAHGIKE